MVIEGCMHNSPNLLAFQREREHFSLLSCLQIMLKFESDVALNNPEHWPKPLQFLLGVKWGDNLEGLTTLTFSIFFNHFCYVCDNFHYYFQVLETLFSSFTVLSLLSSGHYDENIVTNFAQVGNLRSLRDDRHIFSNIRQLKCWKFATKMEALFNHSFFCWDKHIRDSMT